MKPFSDANSVDFVGDDARLNVALTRAEEVLNIFSNFRKWDEMAINDMAPSGCSSPCSEACDNKSTLSSGVLLLHRLPHSHLLSPSPRPRNTAANFSPLPRPRQTPASKKAALAAISVTARPSVASTECEC
ncbi:hypothetical protein BDV10DRAFT_171989 [Aspergillus recurvatus]